MAEAGKTKPKFELVAGWLCLDFVNTINYAGVDQNERLKIYADLVAWGLLVELLTDGEAHHLLQAAQRRPANAQAALEEARSLRLMLHRLFSALAGGLLPDETDTATLNTALSQALAHLRLLWAAEGFTWQWSAEDGQLQQMLWPVVWSAAELLVAAELERVKMCLGTGCSWLFLDRSKNRSRRWCNMQHCGNRAKARRYYERRRK